VDLDFNIDPVKGETFVFENFSTLTNFSVERVFWMNKVSGEAIRGNHFNAQTDELVIPVQGSVTIELFTRGANKDERQKKRGGGGVNVFE
jgi:hypothetical protein